MKRIIILLAAAFTLMWGACSDPYADQVFKDTDKMPAANYMEANEAVYSSWVDLLKYTGLFNTVNLKLDYTCFVPDNEAMQKFLQKKGKSSVRELDMEEAVNLVRYHTIASKQYTTSDFPDGMFPDSTASGDYLSLEMREGGFDAFYINGEARIKELNITTTNAVIHLLEDVLTPVTGTIVDNLDKEDYSLMLDLIEKTGYNRQLSNVYLNGIKYRYTLFAVPDAVFREAGINDITSLATRLGETGTNYTEPANKVNRYVGYHIANSAYSFADMNTDIDNNTSKNVAMMASNTLISMRLINEMFYLNYNEETKKGISVTQKNLNCKNGVIHVVDGLMEIVEPKATKVIWDLTDYPELAGVCDKYQLANQSDSYDHSLAYDTLSCYTLSGGYGSNYQYYLANKNDARYKAVNYDCLYLSLGKYGWIQMQSPMIIAGKYKVSLTHYNISNKTKEGRWSVILDGEYVGAQITTWGNSTSKSEMITTKIGEVEFTESVPHTVRLMAGDDFYSYLDCLIFEPIN
ncbi:fasciclin domain-containing protein [Bacteroides sp.]|uniref:fasciclin domain-containing protein n=1 Tax=Bacteroides sp. TaxID=29523 RepID=UPI0025B7E152|nr:fasciclin domain-containing protein [Bacteroides sp.]